MFNLTYRINYVHRCISMFNELHGEESQGNVCGVCAGGDWTPETHPVPLMQHFQQCSHATIL